MRLPTCMILIALLLPCVISASSGSAVQQIIDNAKRDGIDLGTVPFASAALLSIGNITTPSAMELATMSGNVTKIDTHVHVVPDWYRALVPNTGGAPTPAWDLASHLNFMNSNGIKRGIISISTPGSNVYPGSETLTAALARLLNEWMAALVRAYPYRFSFFAVVPLPYTDAAIKEAEYALGHLGAIGVGVLSNHEGKYLGNSAITPFFQALNNGNAIPVIFMHPTSPVLNFNGSLISANPNLRIAANYPDGLVEYYFETARTITDLTASQTIQNFTKLNFFASHCGGAFPAIEDRFLKSSPALEASSKPIYNSRFFWDSAGPTYFSQVKGLLGYNVPTSQLTYGSDYPYSHFSYAAAITAISNATYLTSEDKTHIFSTNVEQLFGGLLS